MATQHRYDDYRTLSFSKQEAMRVYGNAGIKVYDIHQLSGPAKLILNPGNFVLSYTAVDGSFIKHEKTFDSPYLNEGEKNTIKLTDCQFTMTDKDKPFFEESRRQEIIGYGWEEDKFLTYDDTGRSEIDISPEPEDQGKPIKLRTVFTNDSNFGTRYLWQRIYFYVGDDEYPFFQMNFSKSIKQQTYHEMRVKLDKNL